MRTDYNANIGSRDAMSLERVEKKLNTSVSLANENINSDGLILSNGKTAGGVTSAKYSGGFSNKVIGSKIVIAPGLKGYDLNVRNMVFKHEFMHAWHINSGFGNYNLYSERATSTYSLAYSKAYGINWMIPAYRANSGSYPGNYSWRIFNKIVPLWLK